MRMTKMIAAVALLSMASTPVLAAGAVANPAGKLSVSPSVRAGTATRNNSKLDGPSTISALVLGGLAVAGIVLAVTSGDDDSDSN